MAQIGAISGGQAVGPTSVLLNLNMADRDSLNIIHMNARSIPRHIVEIREILEGSLVHFCPVSETFLNSRCPPANYSVKGYNLFRNDRGKKGGGVAIYCMSKLKCFRVASSESGSPIEYLFVETRISDSKILIGAIYNPPPSTDKIKLLEGVLADLIPRYDLCAICGDLNINKLTKTPERDRLLSLLRAYRLQAIQFDPTCHSPISSSSSLIDYAIVSENAQILSSGQLGVPNISEHDLLFVSLKVKFPKLPPSVTTFRDFRNLDVAVVQEFAFSLDWDIIFGATGVDEKVEILTRNLSEVVDRCVPLRTVVSKKHGNVWYSGTLKALEVEVQRAYNLWRRTRLSDDRKIFCKLRNRFTSSKRCFQYHTISSKLSSCRNNSKLFFKQFGGLWSEDSGSGLESLPFSPDQLNSHFSQSHNAAYSLPMPGSDYMQTGSFDLRCVSADELIGAVSKVKSNARGIDGLPLSFVKLLLPLICPFLLDIFNFSIMSGVFPSAWKTAILIPIKKKTNIESPKDLRPIANYPVFSKIFEYVLKAQIDDYLSSNGFLNPLQSGFRSGHSTQSAVLKVTDDIRRALDEGKVCISSLLDYSNAFLTVNHACFIQKLYLLYGFSFTACKFLYSLLEGRSQMVCLNGEYSGLLLLLDGFAQGMILSPTFFSLHLNDMTDRISHSIPHLYADDTQLLIIQDDYTQAINDLNEDLTEVSNWSSSNGLLLNTEKSLAIYFGPQKLAPPLPPVLDGVPIAYSEVVRNLGVRVDSSLSWEPQIIHICRQIFASLSKLYKIQHMIPQDLRIKIVKTYILPFLYYGDTLFFNAKKKYLSKLSKAVNSCTRFVFDIRPRERLGDRRNILLGRSLENHLKVRVALFFFKLLSTKTPGYLYESVRISERSRNLIVPRNRTNHYNSSMFVSGARVWNNLPRHIKTVGCLVTFKRLIQLHFSN